MEDTIVILKRMARGLLILGLASVVIFFIIYIIENMPSVLAETALYSVFGVLVIAVSYLVGKTIERNGK